MKKLKRVHSRTASLSKAVSLCNLQRSRQSAVDDFPLKIMRKEVENRYGDVPESGSKAEMDQVLLNRFAAKPDTRQTELTSRGLTLPSIINN